MLLPWMAVLMVACGPPSTWLVGVNEIPRKVLFGGPSPTPAARASSSASPAAPAQVAAVPPFWLPPLQGFTYPAPPAKTACPVTQETAPDEYAIQSTSTTPERGKYAYRVDGTWQSGSAKGVWPPAIVHQVSDKIVPAGSAVAGETSAGYVQSDPNPAFEYADSELSQGARGQEYTTTTYGFVPGRPEPVTGNASVASPGAYPPAAANVYTSPQATPSFTYGWMELVDIQTLYSDGSAQDFRPYPAIPLISFPVQSGPNPDESGFKPSVSQGANQSPVQAAAANPPAASQQVMQLGWWIGHSSPAYPNQGKVGVDACGSLIEAWKVNVYNKNTIGDTSYVIGAPGQPCYGMGGYYDVATELGGLIVADHTVIVEGTSTSSSCDTSHPAFTSDRTATVDEVKPTP